MARACLVTPLANPPHTRVRYSNVGPGLLALVVERLSRQPFASALAELVLKPLDIEGYLGAEPGRLVARVAGEFGEHAGSDLEPINSAFWRSLALPWAGLVTTATGALRLVRAYAGFPPDYLPAALLAEATRDQTAAPAGDSVDYRERLRWTRAPWGLGVELRGTKAPHAAPPEAAPESYGHVGGSGGSRLGRSGSGCRLEHAGHAHLRELVVSGAGHRDGDPHCDPVETSSPARRNYLKVYLLCW